MKLTDNNKKIKSKKKNVKSIDSKFELVFCTKHNFGGVTKDSVRQNEHIENTKEKCKFVKFNPQKHNPKYDDSEITNSHVDDDAEEKLTPTQKVLNFAQSHILKTVRSFSNNSNVYGVIKIKEKYRVLFLGSTECIQWLQSSYYDYSGKVHGNDLYKNALRIIIARAVTNQIEIQEIHNRVYFDDNTVFYNLCNDAYELVKIDSKGYSIIKNELDNPLFRRKSNPLEQVKPKKYKKGNPLNELVELLRIRVESRQLFIVHLISFFFEKYPTPIMILHGEQGSAKTTITATVKKIVDPSPENRTSMPDNVDNMNIHFFNRYLTNFDNISYITKELSDNMCSAITGITYNKRELFTDDNEVILTIKARMIVNGITPNIEYPDLMDRSIFYESKFIPKSEKITDRKYDQTIDELLPSILEQIFNSISKVLEIYDSVEPEIKQKERMADFTVLGECISRSLGYDDFSFIEAYQENLKSNSFNALESWPIINIIIDIAQQENKDFEISCTELFERVTRHAFQNNININSKGSRFPKSERLLTNQITNLSPTFRGMGYEITDYKYTLRDGKYKKSSRIFRIKSSVNGSAKFASGTSTPKNNNISNVKTREPKNQYQKTGTK